MHKDAASNPRGMASSLRDIPGQLNRVKKIYTQYLTIAAKTNFFVPATSTVKPVVQTWMPRLWMDQLACHVLSALLFAVATFMAILQFIHRKNRSRLYLAGPPGSIASDVSLTSSAKFGLLLNAGDTDQDLERKLQGMRFGIEHSTGQIIVESEDGNSRIARYANEHMGRARDDSRYSEDIRASLLSKEKHRNSFVGLRAQDQEVYVPSYARQSAIGSIAPSLPSPLASSKLSPLNSPALSTTGFLSPKPTGPPTFTSPPPSSTAAGFPTMKYSAPTSPPPQLRDRDSYHDPFAQSSA
jgi:hypothetical protein